MTTWRRWWQAVWLAMVGGRCGGCGARGVSTPCPQCAAALRAIPAAPHAAFVDERPASQLVRRAKSGHWRGGGRELAPLVLARLRARSPGLMAQVDLVTWVPADRRRRARRGGSLPERLARAIARELQVPARATLATGRGRRAQRGLDRRGRLRNATGAFAMRDSPPSPGQVVLLVDDVRTTGATLGAASAALAGSGCTVVVWAAVGVARREERPSTGVGKVAPSAEKRLRNRMVGADDCCHAPVDERTGLVTARPP